MDEDVTIADLTALGATVATDDIVPIWDASTSSTKSATMQNILDAAAGGATTVLPGLESCQWNDCTTTKTTSTEVYGTQVFCPTATTVNKMAFWIQGPSVTSGVYDIGIYDDSFNLLGHQPITASIQGIHVATLATPVDLVAGNSYYFALVCSTNITGNAIVSRTAANTGKQYGYELGTGGTLPSTGSIFDTYSTLPWIAAFAG